MLVDLITAVVSIFALLISIVSINHNRSNTLLRFYQQGDSKIFKNARSKLYRCSQKDIENIVANTKKDREKGSRIEGQLPDYELALLVSFYETWGKLLQKRLLPIYAFDGIGSILLIRTFEKLKKYIIYRRDNEEETKEDDSFLYAYYFEYIYARVKKRRDRIKKFCKLPLLGKALRRHYYGISKSKFESETKDNNEII